MELPPGVLDHQILNFGSWVTLGSCNDGEIMFIICKNIHSLFQLTSLLIALLAQMWCSMSHRSQQCLLQCRYCSCDVGLSNNKHAGNLYSSIHLQMILINGWWMSLINPHDESFTAWTQRPCPKWNTPFVAVMYPRSTVLPNVRWGEFRSRLLLDSQSSIMSRKCGLKRKAARV